MVGQFLHGLPCKFLLLTSPSDGLWPGSRNKPFPPRCCFGSYQSDFVTATERKPDRRFFFNRIKEKRMYKYDCNVKSKTNRQWEGIAGQHNEVLSPTQKWRRKEACFGAIFCHRRGRQRAEVEGQGKVRVPGRGGGSGVLSNRKHNVCPKVKKAPLSVQICQVHLLVKNQNVTT